MKKTSKTSKLNIIYAQEPIKIEGKSIFLAGPTPRDKNVLSWRPKALELFNKYNFDGTILVPELRNTFTDKFVYKRQIEWEVNSMTAADIVLFWIPRELQYMPGFTTNVEFGYWLGKNESKLRVGIPEDAQKCEYIEFLCKTKNIKVFREIEDLVKTINTQL